MPRGYRDWGRVDAGPASVVEHNTYLTSQGFIIAGGAGGAVIGFFNPANSNYLVRLRRVAFSVAPVADWTGLDAGEVRLFRAPDTGTGDLITPDPTDTAFGAAVLEARINFTVNPTLGVQLAARRFSVERRTLPWEAFLSLTNWGEDLYRHLPGSPEAPITLRPGEGAQVRAGFDLASLRFSIFVHHTEELI